MKFPTLKIGDLVPKYPIIQGGMAIKVSMAKLAAAVANEGGIGVIAGTALKIDELKNEIKKAKELTKGILGLNVMFAATDFYENIKAAIEAGIDLIIYGAGFSRDIFAIGKEHNVPIVPIVSSLKLAKIAEKLGAAAVIVEGVNAGGHLGTDEVSWDIVSEVKKALKIPVIGAGGVITPADVKRMFDLGLDGVQMGSRFVASDECGVSDVFKEMYVNAKEDDIITIESSAGLPANAIRTPMSEYLLDTNNKVPIKKCTNCLKTCNRRFCVNDALIKGHDGDLENGVFFASRDVYKIKNILPVKEIFREIIEYEKD
ncbi:MAG: nitronate monooxygenase [Fusobacteria bacterium]|nr:nitronate monooxygenase [Fusobacteriota bacterium]